MTVFLTVLKVIGIVLLCILGFVLLCLLIVLFVPIRYKVDADIREPGSDGEEVTDRASAEVNLTFLLHLLSARFIYPAEGDRLTVKLAFFKLYPRKKKDKKEEGVSEVDGEDSADEDDSFADIEAGEEADSGDFDEAAAAQETEEPDGQEGSEEPDAEGSEEKDPADAAEAYEEAGAAEAAESGEEEEAPGPDRTEDTEEPGGGGAGEEQASGKEIPALIEIIDSIFEKLESVFEKQELAIKKIHYTISGFYVKISMIRATVESDVFLRAKNLVLKELRRVNKHILPRRYRVEAVCGSEDPVTMGTMMAAAGTLYPVFGDNVKIAPVFDREVFYGFARIRGRVMLIVPAYSAVRLFFNRDVRRLVRRARQIKEKGQEGERG